MKGVGVRRRRGLVGVLVAAGLLVSACASDHVGISPEAPLFLGQSDGIAWPVRTTVWPTFDTAKDPRISQYLPLNKAEKVWTICVSVPTRSVEYYESILIGARTQAKAARVSIKVVSGGPTTTSASQAKFTKNCAAQTQALLLVPVLDANANESYASLLASQKSAGKPVVVTSPGVDSTAITSSVAPVLRLGSRQLGFWLNASANTRPGKVIVLAGPQGSPQVESLVSGLRSTFPGSSLSLAGIYYGSLSPASQAALTRRAIAEHPDAQYIVGVASAIVAAAKTLNVTMSSHYVLASFTYTEAISKMIPVGEVAVAIDDRTVAQGAMAVDQNIRRLQGQVLPAVTAPAVQIIDRTSITYADQTGSLPSVLAANESR